MTRIDRLASAVGFTARDIDRGGHLRLVERTLADPAVLPAQMAHAARLRRAAERRRQAKHKATAAPGPIPVETPEAADRSEQSDARQPATTI